MKPCLVPLWLALAAGTVLSATPAVTPADLSALSARAEKELRGNILPFWLKNARDRDRGGFRGAIDQQMNIQKDSPRGALLTSRILWTFSAAYRRYHDPEYLEMARWAYRDQMENFRDREHGGLFWSITPDGKPLDAHKQIYGQVFGLYALSEYYRATGEPPALAEAISIYRLVDQHAHDARDRGYFDTLTREWQPQKNTGQTLLGPGEAPKSQNSHIHIMEAFTSLLRVWPDAGLRARERELIELMLTRIVDERTHHLVLFMKADWTPIGEEFSYGHDIELSWLLVEAADVLGDPALIARVRPVALAIARTTAAEGVDTDGGIVNEGNARGWTNTNKDWWPQAEAAVGFLNAYQLSGDPKFFAATVRTWNFIDAKFVDRLHGDWYESLKRDGTPLPRMKLSVWKCPYHNSRSCLELIERLERLGAALPNYPLSGSVTQSPADQAKLGEVLKANFEKLEKTGVVKIIPPAKQFLDEAVASGDRGQILRAFQDAIYARHWKINVVIPVVKMFLNDPNPYVRYNAANDLFIVGETDGYATLLALVEASNRIEGIENDV